MQRRVRNVVGTGVALMLMVTFRLEADDKTMLIELDQRSGALPTGVSASGAILVGGLDSGGAFYWMPTTGVIFTGGRQALGVSRDGLTIVGEALDPKGIEQAAIWVRATEWRLLGSISPSAAPCDTSLSFATGASANGQVVVGGGYNGCTVFHAFRWQASTGIVDLGSSVEGKSSRALGVSGDGSVVVGDQNTAQLPNQGARWLNGRQELISGPQGPVGSAVATNHDGSIVVGRVCHPSSDTPQDGWMWTPQNGTTCLPAPRNRISPGPKIIVEAAATSDDGQVIGGSQSVGGSVDSDAVIWIGSKPAYLKDFLQANGVPNAFNTWVNTGTITGISPDGRILVGWGAAALGYRGYIVILGSSRVIPS
jgi:probable HAF family extracellular repeat protein